MRVILVGLIDVEAKVRVNETVITFDMIYQPSAPAPAD